MVSRWTAPAHGLDPRLAAVNDWLYVLQPDGVAGPAAIAASGFDLVVIDYSTDGGESGELTPTEVAAIQQSGKLVLAYMSIGEAEDFRFYWDPAWNDDPPPDADAPAWLGPFNPLFPDNYKVRYWDPAWQALIFGTARGAQKSYLDRILDQGFDGIYLDIIDAFTFWSEEGEVSREFARQEMIAFVQALADYACQRKSDFLVFPQNGNDIVLDDDGVLDAAGQSYLAAIDGIGVEDVFYDELAALPAAEVDNFRTGLLASYLSSGGESRLVLSVDYVWDAAAAAGNPNVGRYNDYQDQTQQRGYVAYAAVSDRDLDEILTVGTGGGIISPQPKPAAEEIFADGFESGDLAAWP